MGRCDEENGITLGLFECLDHVSLLAGLIRDDLGTELGDFLAFADSGMEREASDRIDFF